VSELAEEFDASEMTIHRDLDFLESKGLLIKKRGGAIASSFSETFQIRSTKNLSQKQYIARKVYELIDEYDILALDGSTTAIEVAKMLRNGKSVTVFTNSILILSELQNVQNVDLYCIGSSYSREMVHFVGADVEEQIKNLNFSKCIFGVAGISADLMMSDAYPQLASIKSKFIASSEIAIAAADGSKFGKLGVKNFAAMDDISYLVTDTGVPCEYKEVLEEQGKLIY
ncbi:MAG: DeoR/GlpR family DNA-binding transcription regulator, partial [Christensenella sp.]